MEYDCKKPLGEHLEEYMDSDLSKICSELAIRGMHMIKGLTILCFMIWIHIKQMKQSDYLKIIKPEELSRYIGILPTVNIRWLVFFCVNFERGNVLG